MLLAYERQQGVDLGALCSRATLGTVEPARACAEHRLVLDELEDGSLRCPASPHRVRVWLVVDTATGELLGAGRLSKHPEVEPAVWLGPGLQLGAAVLLDTGPPRYALPVVALPPAA